MSRLGMIAIGQYVPGESFIHRLDPRTKLSIVFAFMLIIFTANNVWTYGAVLGFTFLTMMLSQVSVRFIWRGLKPVWVILLFTFILHIWLTKEGELLFQWGFLSVYEQGVIQALTFTVRIALLVLMASFLTLTTKPLVLTDGLEKLLRPLNKLRFPVHEFALMMAIALRFIPTFMQEVDKLIKAQAARGARFTSGPLLHRMKNIISILVPLFISSFQRADDLALAMEARAYRGGQGRTRLRELALHKRDMLAILVSGLFFLFVLICRSW